MKKTEDASKNASPARRRGRPSSSVLTTPRIVEAATRLLETVGDNFTMAALARELGVAPSSFYNHVSSRDEVMARLSDSVVGQIDTTAFSRIESEGSATERRKAWRRATESWAVSYREAFASRPAVVSILAHTPVAQAPQTIAMYEQVAAGFAAAGWPQGDIVPNIEAIEAFLLGSALDAGAPVDIFEPGKFSEKTPVFTAAYRARSVEAAGDPALHAFRSGLRALLDGYAALIR